MAVGFLPYYVCIWGWWGMCVGGRGVQFILGHTLSSSQSGQQQGRDSHRNAETLAECWD